MTSVDHNHHHHHLSAEDAAIYDRQLRVWGIETQSRLSRSHILIIGLKGIGVEVAKNLSLAGIGALTIIDDAIVSIQDLNANFFINEDDIGKNRALASAPSIQELNPNVKIHAESKSISSLTSADYFLLFDGILLVDQLLNDIIRINDIIRSISSKKIIPMYAAGLLGSSAYLLEDLIIHNYIITKKEESNNNNNTNVNNKINKKDKEEEKMIQESHTLKYDSMKSIINSSWKIIEKSFGKRYEDLSKILQMILVVLHFIDRNHRYPSASDLKSIYSIRDEFCSQSSLSPSSISNDLLNIVALTASCDLSPLAAIIGGIVAQEILKLISGKDEPYDNVLIYTADTTLCPKHAHNAIIRHISDNNQTIITNPSKSKSNNPSSSIAISHSDRMEVEEID